MTDAVVEDVWRLYVENVPGRDAAYAMSEDRIRAALDGIDDRIVVTVRDIGDPDFAALAEADVFVGSGFDPQTVGSHGRSLRIVHCTSADVERYLPLDLLPSGAVLTNSSGVHADKVSEYGLMALLMLNDRIPKDADDQRRHA